MRKLLAAILGSVVLVASFNMPVHANETSLLISEIKTASANSASQEFIEIYNASSNDIDVTGWKVQYIAATSTNANDIAVLEGILRSGGRLLLSSQVSSQPYIEGADFYFNAGLAAAGGHVRIMMSDQTTVVDTAGWGSARYAEGLAATAPSSGSSLVRNSDLSGNMPDTNDNSKDFSISSTPTPQGGDIYEAEPPKPIEYLPVHITELMANPASPLLDHEAEFIELYNPNDTAVEMVGYVLQTGLIYQYTYEFGNYVIEPKEYLVLYASETKLTLANTTSRARLLTPNAEVVYETAAYPSIGENQSWSLFGATWQYSDRITPAGVNVLFIESEESTPQDEVAEATLVPCATGKYRNPLTNRCRNLEVATVLLSPCDDDEERNPLTNRCRKVGSLVSALAVACKTGQERNPLTNRCRKVANNASELKPCSEGQERNVATNRCRKVASALLTPAIIKQPGTAATNTILPNKFSWWIGGIVATTVLGYGMYEWRYETVAMLRRIRSKLSGNLD